MVVIGELKLSFNLELVLQAVDRTAAADEVWLAIRSSGRGREKDRRVLKLCRLLGFGLIAVSGRGTIQILAPAGPYKPRANTKRRSNLMTEHNARRGDPVPGGRTREPI